MKTAISVRLNRKQISSIMAKENDPTLSEAVEQSITRMLKNKINTKNLTVTTKDSIRKWVWVDSEEATQIEKLSASQNVSIEELIYSDINQNLFERKRGE
jgi:hypothetical protein